LVFETLVQSLIFGCDYWRGRQGTQHSISLARRFGAQSATAYIKRRRALL